MVRRRAFFVGAFAATAAWAGCAYDWSFPAGTDPNDPDAGGGAETSTESSTKDVSLPDTGLEGAPPTGACKDNTQCKPTQYCHFDDHSCGLGGVLGKCAEPELSTCSINAMVCTCDGEKFASSCLSTQKLQDPGPGTACEKNDGTAVLCGYLYCKLPAEFCLFRKTPTGPVYSCETMAACDPVDCACTEPAKVVSTSGGECVCSSDGMKGVTVACSK